MLSSWTLIVFRCSRHIDGADKQLFAEEVDSLENMVKLQKKLLSIYALALYRRLYLMAHSHDVHLTRAGVADRCSAVKLNFFYFLQCRNRVPQLHADSQQICSCLNEP